MWDKVKGTAENIFTSLKTHINKNKDERMSITYHVKRLEEKTKAKIVNNRRNL